MSDNRRRFALRENGEETSVFKRNVPRQTALKAARRLEPAESEEEALANTERILGNAGYRFVFLFNLKVGLRAVKGAAKRFIYLWGAVFRVGERSSQDRLTSYSGLPINTFCSEETRFRSQSTR